MGIDAPNQTYDVAESATFVSGLNPFDTLNPDMPDGDRLIAAMIELYGDRKAFERLRSLYQVEEHRLHTSIEIEFNGAPLPMDPREVEPQVASRVGALAVVTEAHRYEMQAAKDRFDAKQQGLYRAHRFFTGRIVEAKRSLLLSDVEKPSNGFGPIYHTEDQGPTMAARDSGLWSLTGKLIGIQNDGLLTLLTVPKRRRESSELFTVRVLSDAGIPEVELDFLT